MENIKKQNSQIAIFKSKTTDGSIVPEGAVEP